MRSLIELDQICIGSKSLTLNHPQPGRKAAPGGSSKGVPR
jgi:hypothetical protein